MTARRGLVGGAVLLLALAAGCSKDVAANDLAVGDCTADDIADAVADVDTVACDADHTYEVFASFELDGDDGADFPGRSDVESEAAAGCNGDRFEEHVGTPYEDSTLHTTYLVPTEDTWDGAGDRTVVCLVFEPVDAEGGDLSPATVQSSFEGAAR
jgi:Septum formation